MMYGNAAAVNCSGLEPGRKCQCTTKAGLYVPLRR